MKTLVNEGRLRAGGKPAAAITYDENEDEDKRARGKASKQDHAQEQGGTRLIG